MDAKDIALLIVAGYVAVTALVRLMAWQRDRLVRQFRDDLERERQVQEAQEKAAAAVRRKAS